MFQRSSLPPSAANPPGPATNGGGGGSTVPREQSLLLADGTQQPTQMGAQPQTGAVNGVGAPVEGGHQQQLATVPQAQPASAFAYAPPAIIPALSEELRELIDEMRHRDFDSIRFATYRTACKLRFVQTKTNVHLVDIWNMIESFRENGLNAMASGAHLKISRLELLLTSVFHNLNKRLPASQQIDTDKSIGTLLQFLLSAYDRQHLGRLTVFAIKVGLATLCAGKLVDKLRYIFAQISEPNGAQMDHGKFAEYLQQVLALPTAVFEGPTFGYSQLALSQCFRHPHEQVTLNQFLDSVLGDSCPPCLMWLPLLHRMASVENVYHPVVCDACQVRSFTGFRYKCQRCTNYQLCQSCFWRGRVSQSHSNEHEMREYSSYKSPTKQLAHSIHKSLQCVPVVQHKTHKEYPARPQRPLDLANVVPSTPLVAVRRQPAEPMAEWTAQFMPGQYGCAGATDDEHKLIARYAAKLAGRTVYAPAGLAGPSARRMFSAGGMAERMLDERAMIARLEEENQEMIREMAALEQQQALCDSSGQLSALRERTGELEARMREKQLLRRQLMEQLEQLMAQLNQSSPLRQGSPAGTGSMGLRGRSTSAGIPLGQLPLLPGLDASFQARGPAVSQLQGDLLQAADAITENMSELVRELERETEPSTDEAENPFPIGARGCSRDRQEGRQRRDRETSATAAGKSKSASKEQTPVASGRR